MPMHSVADRNNGKAPTCEAVFAFKTKNQGNAINLCETLSMNYQLNNVTFGEKTTCIYTSNTFCEDTVGGYYIGRCVQFVKERMTLNDATAYCSRDRRTLLSIIDEAEIRWTTGTTTSVSLEKTRFIIDLHVLKKLLTLICIVYNLNIPVRYKYQQSIAFAVLSPSGPSVWVSNKITDRNVKGFLSPITPRMHYLNSI
uniref:C-type lectin domain-containing protein n=1 Tax=Heterorhabditis bacteriophora TaxID=37862 RepID=A0A1I7XGC0_HETBA